MRGGKEDFQVKKREKEETMLDLLYYGKAFLDIGHMAVPIPIPRFSM